MIRWTWKDKDAAGDYCVVEAIRTDTNIALGQLRGTNMYLRHDSANVVWVNNTVVYLPASGKGSVIRWSLEQNNVSKSVIRPMSPITKHEILKIHVAKDERWWIANGQTFDDQRTSANGLIQVHNVDKNESKQFQGTVCCIGEAVVSDFRKTLLFISDANNGRLSLTIQQLDMDASGESFQPVDISVKMLLTEDCPWMLVPLEGLPIVVVVTTNCVLYFFEIYTGGYLFSQNLDGDKWSVFGDSDDARSLLLYRRSQKSIYRVSVNTDDLIGYIRRVLQDDALAASVAIRTDCRGTDSVMINDMHTPYDDTTNESND
ncbi:hypothetical protein FRC03_009391 [Tulasnella sp. 419]|nr:hypothetical protein FRC03_009391 [Tulasnella sp. 419]